MGVHLEELPVAVLLHIFSFLPLWSVLRLDHLHSHLHAAVSAYLATLRVLTLEPQKQSLLERLLHPQSTRNLSDSLFESLLQRCSRLEEISSIPYSSNHPYLVPLAGDPHRSSKLSLDGIILMFSRKNLRIRVCTSAPLASGLFQSNKYVSIREMRVRGTLNQGRDTMSLHPFQGLKTVRLENVTLDSLPSLPTVEEMILTNVRIEWQGSIATEFPSLKHFNFSGKFVVKSESLSTFFQFVHLQSFTHPSEVLLLSLSRSQNLRKLRIPLDVFGVNSIRAVVERGGFPHLRHFELIGSPLFLGTIGDNRDLESVANLVGCCASSLKYLNLPSTVCFQSFYLYFASKDVNFPRLRHLTVNSYSHREITGDDRNRAGMEVFGEFLRRIPSIENMSLIGYDGLFAALLLPAHLSEVTLPWRNRLPWKAQCDDICEVVNNCLRVKKLRITGLEEIDTLDSLVTHGGSQASVCLALCSEVLEEFSIINTCVHSLSLLECPNLRKFSLHYCPVLTKLLLPASCVREISIFERIDSPYIDDFLRHFSSQPTHSNHCYINLQLHDIFTTTQDDYSVPTVQASKFERMGSKFAEILTNAHSVSSCLLTRNNVVHLHHSSTEQLFACTDFHPDSYGRMDERMVQGENTFRTLVREAIWQWIVTLEAIRRSIKKKEHNTKPAHPFQPYPHLASTTLDPSSATSMRSEQEPVPIQPSPGGASETLAMATTPPKVDSSTVSFLHKPFECWTNVPCILRLNNIFKLPSTLTDSESSSIPTVLGIPRLTDIDWGSIESLCSPCHDASVTSHKLETLGLDRPILFLVVSGYLHTVDLLYEY